MARFAHLERSQCWLIPVVLHHPNRATMVWGGQLTCTDCSPLQELHASYDLRRFSSFSGSGGQLWSPATSSDHFHCREARSSILWRAEQRSFMQMPLQMNAQAIFLLLFVCFLWSLRKHAATCRTEGEWEGSNAPFLLFSWVFFQMD